MRSGKNAGIISIGSAVPEKVLSNADLEKIVDTTDEWIRTRTGISERRMAADGEATSDYAVKAARVALERANLEAEDIDLIIVATVTGDMPFPATASIVQNALGGGTIPAFDLAAGCSGWVYALSTANAFVTSGAYNRVLVIGADLLTRVTNWTDRERAYSLAMARARRWLPRLKRATGCWRSSWVPTAPAPVRFAYRPAAAEIHPPARILMRIAIRSSWRVARSSSSRSRFRERPPNGCSPSAG